ncbi:hypothetical protein NT6N_20130 [Oceaniferula spumae]|uniref:alpha-L-fucosidase n=1 Tax=Oceaniferula spumae TaxID=2979115 RepID=A0AAT9FLZ3_9BACT
MKSIFTLFTLASAICAQEKHTQFYELKGNETDAQKLEIASNIVPHARQVTYHKEEFIGFIHFGPNTFTGKEWGSGKESAAVFAPKVVDTDNWCENMKKAGMTKVVITVKHHDGYCTWQTRYNDEFSVKQSPWKDGKGDVLRQLSESCKKYGLRLGVYLSPADLYQIEHKDGLYGNLSKKVKSTIPTEPSTFKTDPTKRRATPGHTETFEVMVDDYNRYFMNQLYEVLTEYGTIHEVWFDGAHPKRKGGQTYDKEAWFKLIRKLQPEAVIFGGPDIRWCGNEAGHTRANEWNVLPVANLTTLSGLDRTAQDLGSDSKVTEDHITVYKKKYPVRYLNYTISEVDTSIRHGWFWKNDTSQHTKSTDWAFDCYERCVGGNAVFLLNVPPTTDGKFSPRDTKVLLEMGQRIKATYSESLAKGHDNKPLDDKNLDTYWQPANQDDHLVITLPEPKTINRFQIQESITKVGQRIKSHALDAFIDGNWKQISEQGVVGYSRIHRFADVNTAKFRIRFLDSRGTPSIADVAAFHYKAPPAQHLVQNELPRVSNKNWKVTASSQHSGYEAKNAIDGNPKTYWHTSWEKGHPVHPHTLTIELAKLTEIKGFTYLPRQDRRVPDSMIEAYEIQTSKDGTSWTTVMKGEFGNLLNDPTQRITFFPKPINTKYIRLKSLRGAQNKPYAGAAEIELLAK